jgi:hypothetical protein
MQTKQYGFDVITKAWAAYKKRVVYRGLVNGYWQTFTTAVEAKAAQPHKIEVKLAKDVIEFPAFLSALDIKRLD